MRRTWSAAILWLMVLGVWAIAQTKPLATAQDIDALLAEARALMPDLKLAEAKLAFDRALEAAQRLGLLPQQASALCGIGQLHLVEAKYVEGRSFGLRCLELAEQVGAPFPIGAANDLLAHIAVLSVDFPEAQARSRRAIAAFEAAGNRAGKATAELRLLNSRPQLAPGEAERLLANAVEDARAGHDRTVEATALHAWADALFSRGAYDDAYDKLEQARTIYEETGNRLALGTVFNSLGRIYRAHGQLEEALRLQLKALELHQASGTSVELTQSLNAVAAVHGMLGHVKEAGEYYERALVLAEKTSAPGIQDFLRANVANALIWQGEFDQAVPMLELVIAHGLDAYPSLRQSQLSFARLKLGQPREALAAAEKAIEICGSVVNDCIAGLRERARARAALGDQAAARADIADAMNRVEKIRTQLVPTDFFKQEFPRTMDSLYSEAIALNVRAREDARALEAAELARSRAFVDLLATRAIDPGASSIVFRGSPGSSGGTAELSSHVMAPPASVADMAASATRLRSTFVVYWVADDAITVWTVMADGSVQAHRVSVLRSRLEDLVRATANAASGASATSQLSTVWRELYDLLIQPVRAALPRTTGSLLTIVPHGPLVNLSFAALQDPRGRYLLEDYAIHYAPAASMFQFTETAKRPAGRTGGLLLIADPSLPVRSRLDAPLPSLAGARAEAEAIARLVPAGRAVTLRGPLATEPGVRTAANGKTVLHFATHAIVRDDDPFASFLALSATPGDTSSDGLLTAQEIYGWSLHADLVVLSACKSGAGHITGDGVATFARAFIYAGTPSLVVSLWDVADEAASRLLPGFYRSWFSGQSKARALRAAQLRLLQDLRAGKVQIQTPAGLVTLPEHPVFWAGFALIGEPD